MELKSTIITPIYIDEIAQEIKNRVDANEENRETISDKYGEGYMEGYHDAMIELLNWMGVEHDQEFYN